MSAVVSPTELDEAVPDVARAAWERVCERWDDPAAHDELLRLTTLHGCYAWTAARYRESRATDRGEDAARQLARVQSAAAATLAISARARPERPGPYRSTLYVLGVLVLLLLLGMAYASYVRGQGRPGGGAAPGITAPAARAPVSPAAQVR